MSRRTALLLLIPVLLVAATFRLARLGEVPPGVTHDEAAHLQDARRIWEGARPIYLTSGYGREPLYDYVNVPLVGLLGMQVTTGRLSSAMWGLALVALTYAAMRGPLGEAGALAAALLMAVSFWPLSISREILRSITMPVLFTAAMALFWRGLYGDGGRHRVGPYIGAGALLGLGFYTYMPARAMWVVPLLFWLTLAVADRVRFRRAGRGMAAMLAVMAAAAAPFLIYLAAHPELEVRVAELAAPLRAAGSGDPSLLLRRMGEAALMFSHRGDVHWMYNLSGRPLLPLPLAVLFYLGLFLALMRWREPGPRLLLLWLLVGVAPALVTGLESSSLRAIAAQPAVFGLCLLPFVELRRWRRRSQDQPQRRLLAPVLLTLVFIVLCAWVAADTARAYFVTWANHRDVRVAYHVHLAAEAAYLDEIEIERPVAISTFYPRQPHDPSAMEVLWGQADPRLRWFDGRGALVFPSEQEALLLVPSAVPLDPALEGTVLAHATPLPAISLRPDDLVTGVAVLKWDVAATLGEALAETEGPVGWFEGEMLPADFIYHPLKLPVALEEGIELVGYRLLTPSVEPGGEVTLMTLWRVGGPLEELVLFAHLLDDEGHVLAQADRLDAPAWNWHPGDVVAQVHRFSLSEGVPPGRYHLQVGVYRQADGDRLSVLVEGTGVDDRVLLHPVEVPEP